MGYRSQVYLKTTTEGYVTFKQFDEKIANPEDKALSYMEIEKTPSGYYRISHDWIKWYDSYVSVQNFDKVLRILEETNIPFKFVRIGEDTCDIEERENWTDDMPEEVGDMGVEVNIYDPDDGSYEKISDTTTDK